jgi:hypothetical protein
MHINGTSLTDWFMTQLTHTEPADEQTCHVSSQHSVYAQTESVIDAIASNFTNLNYYAGSVE